jgi:putative phage-type endonuclease
MSFEVIDLKQGSSEWLNFRKNHIGASEAPIIMGESPWTTPYGLWQQKLGLVKDKEKSKFMQHGLDMEPFARKRYEELCGIAVEPVVLKSKKYSFMIASLDGISKSERIVEIKCPGDKDHEMAKHGTVPKKYLFQLLQQMVVTGQDRVDYFSYRSDEDCIIVPVLLDSLRDQIDGLVEKEQRFWECLQNLEEPALIEDDYVSRSSLEWELTCVDGLHAKKQAEFWEKKWADCREKLIVLSEGKNSKGAGVIITQHVRKGSVDYSKIPELKGLDLEPYRKSPSSYWKIREG